MSGLPSSCKPTTGTENLPPGFGRRRRPSDAGRVKHLIAQQFLVASSGGWYSDCATGKSGDALSTRAFVNRDSNAVAKQPDPLSAPHPAFPPKPIPFRYRSRLPALTKNALCILASHVERYLPMDPMPGFPERMCFTALARRFGLRRWRRTTKGTSVYNLLEQVADNGYDLGDFATCIIKRGVRLRRLRGVRIRISHNRGQEPVWREDIAEACVLLERMGITAPGLKEESFFRGVPHRLLVEMDRDRNAQYRLRWRYSAEPIFTHAK